MHVLYACFVYVPLIRGMETVIGNSHHEEPVIQGFSVSFGVILSNLLYK